MDHLWLIAEATFVLTCVACAFFLTVYAIAAIVSAARGSRKRRRNWRVR